jgi:tol-pal system protein YbgF
MLGKEQKSTLCHTEGGGEVVATGNRAYPMFAVYCLLFTLYCFFSGCATSSDVDLLRQDIDKLQRDSISTGEEVKKLKEKTTGVAKEESFNVVRESQAEIESRLSNVSRDLQVLSGRFDENKYFVEKTLKDSSGEMDLVKAEMASIERRLKETGDRLSALEGHVKQFKEGEKKPEQAQEGPRADEGPSGKSGITGDKTAQYEAAYDAFRNKSYKDAREKFEAFIKAFPKDQLTDNAHFWIAETYYGEKDFEGAILAYESFLKAYPKSKKVPAALLKQGISFFEIGDKKTGKVILDQLIERYPKSKEAELARKNLEDLKKRPLKKKK